VNKVVQSKPKKAIEVIDLTSDDGKKVKIEQEVLEIKQPSSKPPPSYKPLVREE